LPGRGYLRNRNGVKDKEKGKGAWGANSKDLAALDPLGTGPLHILR